MTEPGSNGSRLSTGKKILLSAFLVLAMLVVLEVALRILAPSREGTPGPYDLSFHTQEGERISLRPGPIHVALSPWRVYRLLPDQETDRVSINSLGFRGEEIPRERGERTRVIVIGGSAAFGLGAADDSETIAGLLEAQAPDLEVVNAGVPGYLSGQELAYVVHELVDLDPDWIVAYDGWNDLFDPWYSRRRTEGLFGVNQNFFKIESELAANYHSQARFGPGLRRFAGMLMSRTALLGAAGRRLLEGPRRRAEAEAVVSGSEREPYLEAIVEAYAANLRGMRDHCRTRGIRFLVVFQPEAGQKPRRSPEEERQLARGIGPVRGYAGEFPSLYRRFLDRSAETLEAAGIEPLDVSRAEAFRGREDRLFLDVVHTTLEGNRVVAELLLERLRAADADDR
jgi:hypothetical protein